ncbi:MAG: YkgJ family cysteine cluster protein [Lentisphaeraceae bacterium]|nr:YkgJ family cysteine cluster protein [Lentisphaeraceae bacterium]
MKKYDDHLPPGKKWLCQRCGNCCRWPGDVLVSGKEIDKIAEFLEMDSEDFLEIYVELTANGKGLTLVSNADGSCIFLDGKNACRINPVKPVQCGGFPNTWFFEGWQESCEAILVDEDKFEQEQDQRDKNLL